MASSRLAQLLLGLLLVVSVPADVSAVVRKVRRKGGRHAYTKWDIDSHATFYGGADAAGTMGGACGYGNLYSTGYGTQTAAASSALWVDGKACGACFQVMCINSRFCRQGAKTTVTVTNNCPNGSEGGWCDGNRKHLDMAAPAWLNIGTDLVGGVLSTAIRRVPCQRKGGINFNAWGNPFWFTVVVTNVAGPGDIGAMELQRAGTNQWKPMGHNWGAGWSADTQADGTAIHFRITTLTGKRKVICWNALPSGWSLGGTFQNNCQFGF